MSWLSVKRLIFVLLLIFVTSCTRMQEPKITLEATISPLTEKEYESLNTYDIENPSIEDFRKFDLYLEVKHSPENKLEVDFPTEHWRKEINKIDDKKRYWNGAGYELINEDYVKYKADFVIYTKGLNEQDIKNAYEYARFTIKWLDGNEVIDTSIYSVSDVIEFQSDK